MYAYVMENGKEIGETELYVGEESETFRLGKTPWDAFVWASGPVLYMVEIPDDAVPVRTQWASRQGMDSYESKKKRYVKGVEVTDLLRRYAAMQILFFWGRWRGPSDLKEYLADIAEARPTTRYPPSIPENGMFSRAADSIISEDPLLAAKKCSLGLSEMDSDYRSSMKRFNRVVGGELNGYSTS